MEDRRQTLSDANCSTGFWLLFMGLLCLVYLICSIRTNIVFVIIFLSLVIAFGLLTGAYWMLAQDYTGNAAKAHKLVVVRLTCPSSEIFSAFENAL